MTRRSIKSAFATLAALTIVATFAAACGDLTGPESPSTPADVRATLAGPNSATVTWTPSPLNDGVISYSIFRNGTKVGESTTTTYTDTGLAPQTQYVYSVAANCKSGIVSDRSVETPAATVTTVDITAPTVISRQPPNGSTNVSASATASVTFSEPMDPATINANTFTLRVTATNAVIQGIVTYTPATRVADFTPSGGLPNPAGITATITAGAKDLAGNPIVATSWTFTTRDQTPPAVSAVSPVAGATGVAPGTAINVTFNEAMDAATITNANITLRTASGAAVPGAVNYNVATRVATFTPTSALAQNTGYTLTVSTAVKDVAGNALASNFTSTFTTGDTTAPSVVSTVPVDGATGVPINAPISATFSEAMDSLTINNSTFTLRVTIGGTPVAGVVRYNPTTFVATFTPTAPLAGGTGYIANITTGAKDLSGNNLTAVKAWGFVTADVAPPTVQSVVPADNLQNVPLNTTVKVTFSESMDGSSINQTTITLRPSSGGADVPATVSYDPSTFVATLTPNAPLAGNTTYTVTVSTVVRDAAGNRLAAPFVSTFKTLTPDTTAPTVTGVNPLDNAIGLRTDTVVRVSFSEPMDQTTINTTNITLKNTATNAPVNGTVTYDAANRVAIFTPSGPLANSTQYTLTVTGVKDLSQNPLATPFTSRFTTAAPADNTPPTIISRTPTNGATGIAINSDGTITFSEPMDPATINTTTITLSTTVGGVPVPSVVTYAGNVATINPNADLANNTSYTLTVTTGVTDVTGNHLAPTPPTTFTTAPDTTPPTVVSRTPTALTGVARDTAVTFTFSEDMKASTINGSTVTLVTTTGSVPVTGLVTYDVATRTARFKPSSNLAASTEYRATVTTGAKDLNDIPLAGNFSFTFTTGTTPP